MSSLINTGTSADLARVKQAFYHTNQALRVFTRKHFPNEWAQVQHNLGALYYTDVRGDRADNIERAIASYNRALSVHTNKPIDSFMV